MAYKIMSGKSSAITSDDLNLKFKRLLGNKNWIMPWSGSGSVVTATSDPRTVTLNASQNDPVWAFLGGALVKIDNPESISSGIGANASVKLIYSHIDTAPQISLGVGAADGDGELLLGSFQNGSWTTSESLELEESRNARRLSGQPASYYLDYRNMNAGFDSLWGNIAAASDSNKAFDPVTAGKFYAGNKTYSHTEIMRYSSLQGVPGLYRFNDNSVRFQEERRIFIQSGTPTGAVEGDIWFQI